eukprot:CAMPEP_0178993196 /NCGR_PEP_ID=MMETSP0795-20121207/6567_1 /TAXON_ID=88552 /ORGANISM="Amoebophrya sp., Strain Ameob2" /LENGTH=157 /DNA_ID=CAMNT_0020685225 /DNA_START=121 /DNA_END=591 /DNA_ORIENTATION=-
MPAPKRKLIVDAPSTTEFEKFEVKLTWEPHPYEDVDDEESEYEFEAETAEEVAEELKEKYGQDLDREDIQSRLEEAATIGIRFPRHAEELCTFTWGQGEYTVTATNVQEIEKSQEEEDFDDYQFVKEPALKLPKTDDRGVALEFIEAKGLKAEFARW